MLALQVSIGALNDAVDARVDAGRKPAKPIPRGEVSRRAAVTVSLVALATGLALTAPSGLPALAVAAAGVACGYAYDLLLSRTPLSWLPLSVALPLLPIHAWLGATGAVPPGLATLVPAAVAGGAGLAVANGLVDAERDLAAGRATVVVHLGQRAAWLVHLGLVAGLACLAAAWMPGSGPGRTAGLGIGLGLVAVGAVALRAKAAGLRERAWELEAVGVAVLGVAWLAGAAAEL